MARVTRPNCYPCPSENLFGHVPRTMAAISLFATLLLSLVTRTNAAAGIGSVLYDASDPLQIIDGTDSFFRMTRSPASYAYLVEFYNSWCGHCIRYAPLFKEFAGDIKGWQSIVDIGVINCASDVNYDICRNQEINAYPTLKLYWVGDAENKQGEVMETHRELSTLRKGIIDYLQKKIKHFEAPGNFLDLNASRITSLETLWAAQSSNVTQILAVVEDETSYVGRELILDFSNIHHVKVVRFVRGSGPEEIRNRDATSLLVIDKGVHPRLLTSVADNSVARKEFKSQLTKMGFNFERKRNRLGHTLNKLAVRQKIGDIDKVYLDDVEAGLVAIFNQELMVRKEFNERELIVLRDFIQSVYDNIFLPSRIKVYLQKLRHLLEVPAPLSNADFVRLLKEATSSVGYLREKLDYFGCKGSVPNKRGYTCSLWTIFHLMTVGSHQRYRLHQIDDPRRSVFAVKEFVSNYFTCRDCVEHFSGMAKNLENELSTPEESVLWLWRAHNKVNERLKGDPTEDPERPKIQFPPQSLCKNCSDASGKFIESHVLAFLEHHYNASRLVQAVTTFDDPLNMGLKQEVHDTNGTDARMFSGFDVTIFLVIYAVSVTLLFAVFITMVFRRRKGSYNKSLFRLS